VAVRAAVLVVLAIPRLVGVKRRLAGCGATRPWVRRSWAVAEAAVPDADQPVGQRPQGLVVGRAAGALLVVVGPGAG
jgi:hypothetical protein